MRRFFLRALTVLGSVLLAVAALLGGAFVLANTDTGRERIGAWISDNAEGVTVTGLGGTLPFSASIERLTLADDAGVWLTARGAALSWNPWRLLDGVASLSSLTVRQLDLARPPVSAPESDSDAQGGGFALSDLPLAVTIGHLAIDDLALGAAIAGQATRLTVTADARIEPVDDIASASLAIVRADGIKGAVTVKASYRETDRFLDLAATLDEPDNGVIAGILARALERPITGPVTGEVAGTGRLDDFDGTLMLTIGDAGSVSGGFSVRGDPEAALDFATTIEADLAGLMPPPYGALAAGPIDIDAEGRWTAAGNAVALERTRLAGPGVDVTASGTIGLDAETMDLTVALALADLGRLRPLAGEAMAGQLRAEARLRGRLEAPDITLDMTATALETEAAGADTLIASVQAHIGSDRIPLTIDAEATGMRLADLPAESPVLFGARTVIAAQGNLVSAPAIRLAFDEFSLWTDSMAAAGPVILDLAENRLTGNLSLSVDDLGAFAALTGLESAGGLTARVTPVVDLAGGALEADIGARLTDFDVGIAELRPLLGPVVSVNASLRVAPDGAIAVSGLWLAGRDFSVGGDARITGGNALDASLTVTLDRLDHFESLVGQSLGDGQGAVALRIAGTVDRPALSASYRLDGVPLPDLGAVALGPVSVDGWLTMESLSAPGGQAAMQIHGDFPAILIQTDYLARPARIGVRDLVLNTDGLALNGDLEFDPGTGLVEGTLGVTAERLSPWAERLGQDLSGRLEASARLEAVAGGGQKLAFDIDAGEVGFGRSLVISRARLRADGTESRIAGTVSIQGDAGTAFALDSGFELRRDGDRMALVLNGLAGEARGIAIAAGEDVALGQDGPRLWVRMPDLRAEGARLALTADIGGDAGMAVDLALDAVPIGLLAPEFTGRADISLTITGAPPHPDGNLSVTLTDLRAADPDLADIPGLSGRADGVWRGGQLRVTVPGFGITDASLSGDLQLPLALADDGISPVIDGATPVAGTIDLAIDLAVLSRRLLDEVHVLAGQVNGRLVVAGSVGAPNLEGRAGLGGGRYENTDLGTVIEQLALSVTGDGNGLDISFSGTDSEGGRLAGDGRLNLVAGNSGLSATATITDFVPIRLEEATFTANGDIAVDGALNDLAVTGSMVVSPGEIRVPDQVPASVTTLDVIEINRPGQPPPQPEDPDPAPGESGETLVTLDYTIEIPGRVFVRGRGVNSEWRGRLRITGPATAPIVTGQLDLVRGRLSLLGKTFDLRSGQVLLDETAPDDPFLDITAAANADGLTAVVEISGRASAPEVTITSEPPLPEDEVISRLLFGESVGALSPIQALQLAEGVASLSGGGGGIDIFETIRQTVGVDVLEVDSSGDDVADSTVRAGTYLSDGTLLSVEQGAGADSTRATLEMELTPHISVETGVGANADSSVGVNIKTDY